MGQFNSAFFSSQDYKINISPNTIQISRRGLKISQKWLTTGNIGRDNRWLRRSLTKVYKRVLKIGISTYDYTTKLYDWKQKSHNQNDCTQDNTTDANRRQSLVYLPKGYTFFT